MLKKLELANYRSYKEAGFTFASGINAIIGRNGSGKTNLLEAVYVLARQKSFRSPLKSVIKHGAASFRIDGVIDNNRLSFRFNNSLPAKTWRVNGHNQRPRKDQLPNVVLFEPEFLRFITGSPGRRREYLNELTALLYPGASVSLRRYDRVLLQRNNLLKKTTGSLNQSQKDQLFVWNVMLAELAAKIDNWRLGLVDRINDQISDHYSQLAGNTAVVSLRYNLTYEPTQQTVLHTLQRHEQSDLRYGHTSIGPHRNDVVTSLSAKPADSSASRGEQRSIAASLKLIELAESEQIHEKPAVLLLDDVLSELDSTRQSRLLSLINAKQTLLTDTDIKHVKYLKDLNIIRL